MNQAIAPGRDSETLLSYAGNVSNTSIDQLLELAEHKLEQQASALTTRKKVFNILVETLQNAYNHLDGVETDSAVNFKLEKDNFTYTVIAGNPVKNNKVAALKKIIDKFNSMSGTELKDYYRSRLSKGHYANNVGAGLGLVEIIRKSGKKISYSFKPVNKDYSYFSLQVRVSE